MSDSLPNLVGFSKARLQQFFVAMGEKPYRARQLLQWIHQRRVLDFDQMTDISLVLRERLKTQVVLNVPQVAYEKASLDGTVKWLMRLSCGNCIETVFIPEPGRGTLCVSSQIGCSLNCSFCSTAAQGFSRNLTADEIIGQLWQAYDRLSVLRPELKRSVTNVVMMGMGEPLMNFEPVIDAMSLMVDDLAYGLSKRKVTLSTSGVVPKIEELGRRLGISLAVSLHAPNDELRNQLVPINKKYPLEQLLSACRDYANIDPHRSITMEYVMLSHVNDSIEHAKQLVEILSDVPSKINLIPFNVFPKTQYKTSSGNRIHAFMRVLSEAGFIVTIRKTRGDDIDAACGQLVGDFSDRTTRRARRENPMG